MLGRASGRRVLRLGGRAMTRWYRFLPAFLLAFAACGQDTVERGKEFGYLLLKIQAESGTTNVRVSGVFVGLAIFLVGAIGT